MDFLKYSCSNFSTGESKAEVKTHERHEDLQFCIFRSKQKIYRNIVDVLFFVFLHR